MVEVGERVESDLMHHKSAIGLSHNTATCVFDIFYQFVKLNEICKYYFLLKDFIFIFAPRPN